MSQMFQCHYMRSCIYNANKKYHSSDKNGKYENFKRLFPHVVMNQSRFNNYQKRFLEFSKKNVSMSVKNALLSICNEENWCKLDQGLQILHTVNVCEPCKHIIVKGSETPTTPPVATFKLDIEIPLPETPKSRDQLGFKKAVATAIWDEVNMKWDNHFKDEKGLSYTEVLEKCSGSNIKAKLNASEKKKATRATHRKIKTSLENKYQNVDTCTLYGTRQSGAQYENQRFAHCFESKEDAQLKAQKRSYI